MKLKKSAEVLRVQYVGSVNDVVEDDVQNPITRTVYVLPHTPTEDLVALGQVFEKLGREKYIHQIVATKQTLLK